MFGANESSTGFEMYVSNGTPSGTFKLDLRPGSASSFPTNLTPFGGRLYFEAEILAGVGREVYSTDLTVSGTQLLVDAGPGSALGGFDFPTVSGGKLYWAGGQGSSSGEELWVSDGTTVGSQQVLDLAPGSTSSFCRELVAANGGVYFQARENSTIGNELYFSDGTAGGTFLACDMLPGPGEAGRPQELTPFQGELVMWAHDPANPFASDQDLWRLGAPGAVASDLGLAGGSAVLTAGAPAPGQPWTVQGDGNPAGSVAVLLYSLPVAGPSTLLTLPGSVSWIDPATFGVFDAFLTASWTFGATIPNDPALAGKSLHLQSWHLPGATLPALTSNGVVVVLG